MQNVPEKRVQTLKKKKKKTDSQTLIGLRVNFLKNRD